ncbi:Piso0_000268 [Millerozyma farinosa CBS 7064]|uniref:Piso0_000268 protein n=1 Tax=Pichia sorbitophila (strain ATCC MYA-4447 / BCRC 22081 / CBS 7064 / NBRC 10061 / NRRL Y-12695) TaxID=559304 RepID=G8YTI8_PICSO|nr:Piso0_000268 [Millerozyma farinosa CBS 7064]
MVYTFLIEWPDTDVNSVQVTGNFDNWSMSEAPLTKTDTRYVKLLTFSSRKKIVFKFVVNNEEWCASKHYKIEEDEHGNQNNYIDADDLVYSNGNGDDEQAKLTHVLTSSSSFAAVSLPETASTYENLSKSPFANASDAGIDRQISNTNTALEHLQDSSVILTESSNQHASESNDPAADSVEIFKTPGAYPSPIPSEISSTTTGNIPRNSSDQKRDGLLTKFKSFFKY